MSEAAEESDSESQLSETADEKRERLLRRRRWRRQRQRVVKSRRLTSAVLLLSTCSTTTTTAPTYKHTYIEREVERERHIFSTYVRDFIAVSLRRAQPLIAQQTDTAELLLLLLCCSLTLKTSHHHRSPRPREGERAAEAERRQAGNWAKPTDILAGSAAATSAYK